jgi:hypothetical protein
MWTTVVVLALALNLEPNRLGIIGLLFLRPNPIRQLLVFLCASFLVSSTGGLLVLFLIHRGSVLRGEFSGSIIQIGMGTLALAMAAVLFSNIPMPGSKRGTADSPSASPSGSVDDSQPAPVSGLPLVDAITKRAGRLAQGRSLWFPAALGLGISLPSVDYVALLLLIAASGETPKVQVAALFTFLTVANAILLVPIISYVVARQRTLRILGSLRSWVLARTRRDYALVLVVVGALMIAVGLSHL